MERLVRGYRRAVSLESAEAAHRDRFLATEWDEDGSLMIRGRLSPEDGALFLKALEAGKEAIHEREVAAAVCYPRQRFGASGAQPRGRGRPSARGASLARAGRAL